MGTRRIRTPLFFAQAALYLLIISACSDGTTSSDLVEIDSQNQDDIPTATADNSTPILGAASIRVGDSEKPAAPDGDFGQPSPGGNSAQPEPVVESAQPEPESEPVQPEPESEPVQPEPESESVQPEPESESLQPEPEGESVEPVPDSDSEQPAPALESSTFPPQSPLRVFPGAEGFGTTTVGGRGGRICKVINLNESGPGSFRECAESSGPRIVVFETGGTIEVSTSIYIDDPFISIYGQTAPGDGIMLRASLGSSIGPLHVRTHDVLIQHLRMRAGTSQVLSCCRDAMLVNSPVVGAVYNVVIDHNSLSWGSDQITSLWYDPHDITFSNNIISESLFDSGSNTSGPAGRGFLVGSAGAHSISIHNNLFAHSYQRNPLVKTSGIVDITNNLIYHWISRGGQQHATYRGQKANWVKNHYVAKQSEPNGTAVGWGDILLVASNHPIESYFQGNIGYNRPSDDLPEWQIANTNWGEPYNPALGYHSDTRFPAPPISEVNAVDLEQTLVPHVGATAPKRDSVDLRVMNQLATRTGKMPNCVALEDRPGDSRCNNNVGGWPVMAPGVAKTDSDNDGIPDDWELAHGLNPQLDDSRLDINGDGYQNIEDYAFDISRMAN
ncbi:MAG: hypothetical protein AB8B64_16615, partial [Granulosicoccus sp.]